MIFTNNLGFPEGPVSLTNGSWLVVEIAPERGSVTQISPTGNAKRTIAKTGRPNGLAVDRSGAIWVAESKVPSLLRVTLRGKKEIFATECQGEPLLFPNDLCFGPDGALYLTDSGILIDDFAPDGVVRADYKDVRPDGRVYRIDTQSGTITKLDSGIRFTNGLAFGPDLNLYVNETLTGEIYRYIWDGTRVLPGRQRLANVIRPDAPEGMKGPDGMAFDSNGLLYCAVFGQGDVTVLNLAGNIVQRIPTGGSMPTNVAFSVVDRKSLYVTEAERGCLEKFEVDCEGLKLWE
jgi:gluconolactonase